MPSSYPSISKCLALQPHPTAVSKRYPEVCTQKSGTGLVFICPVSPWPHCPLRLTCPLPDPAHTEFVSIPPLSQRIFPQEQARHLLSSPLHSSQGPVPSAQRGGAQPVRSPQTLGREKLLPSCGFSGASSGTSSAGSASHRPHTYGLPLGSAAAGA